MATPEGFIEQNIKTQALIPAGTTVSIFIDVPSDRIVSLRGYGYDFFPNTTYTLDTGNNVFPSRTDQEGSIGQPQIWGTPFRVRSGGKLQVHIQNNGTFSSKKLPFFLPINRQSSIIYITSWGLRVTASK